MQKTNKFYKVKCEFCREVEILVPFDQYDRSIIYVCNNSCTEASEINSSYYD